MINREDILLCTLYRADESLLGRDLILELDEKVSREEAITPMCLMSICSDIWEVDPKMPYGAPLDLVAKVRENLTDALSWAWMLHAGTRKIKAKAMRNKMRGWRISNGHKLRRIKQQCKAAGIELSEKEFND